MAKERLGLPEQIVCNLGYQATRQLPEGAHILENQRRNRTSPAPRIRIHRYYKSTPTVLCTDDQQISRTKHDLYISTEVIHTATLKYAAVLPSKDSACCPPLRRSGDKIYHTPVHPPPWRVHRSIQRNFKEAPALLGIGYVGLVRGKTWDH
jgi:hypothetical protein